MQRLLFKILAPALVFAAANVGELPASTFGGSTGPRQGAEDLPRMEVDSNTYRRTRARLSVDEYAPVSLPSGAYTVKKAEEEIIEYNKMFILVPRD